MNTGKRVRGGNGRVVRVVNPDLAYIEDATGKGFCFSPRADFTSPSEDFGEKRRIAVGESVRFDFSDSGRSIRNVQLIGPKPRGLERPKSTLRKEQLREGPRNSQRSGRADVLATEAVGAPGQSTPSRDATDEESPPPYVNAELALLGAAPPVDQLREHMELLPDAGTESDIRVEDAIPPKTRSFGKLVDVDVLLPGDLLLVRDLEPRDQVSRIITDVQVRGGYAYSDARWTHAAMYVGDGRHVVEATFDSIVAGGSVRLTKLAEYCQGTSVLRFRRPVEIRENQMRWSLCVQALSRLRNDYSFIDCIRMWVAVRFLRQTLADVRRQSSRAVVCSTLYADAFSEAVGRTLGDRTGTCVPAWLSASSEFSDVKLHWRKIV